MKKVVHVEPEELIARIVSVRHNYFISRADGRGGTLVDDEAILDIEGAVTSISKRHCKHLGEPISISLIHAARYTGWKQDISPFFGSVRLRGSQRSALAYLPVEPFGRLPQLIDRGAQFLELRFSPLRHGFGELLSLYVADTIETPLEVDAP
jgi:hypothetical protein